MSKGFKVPSISMRRDVKQRMSVDIAKKLLNKMALKDKPPKKITNPDNPAYRR